MRSKKIGAWIFSLALLIVIGFTLYRFSAGNEVGFNEVIAIAAILMGLLSSLTWGTKEEQDGILQEEELGQRVTEKSSKISYFVLTFFILIALAADHYINGTTNIFLLILMGLAMITLPFVEFLYIKKYK